MDTVEVFADVACPFTHVGLRRFVAYRRDRGAAVPVLRVRAWPLELINGKALDATSLKPKIDALRAGVAPELFGRFDVRCFPATTLPALASEAAAYRQGLEAGERFSLAVRQALFEDGLDISDEAVLQCVRRSCGVADPSDADRSAVCEDLAEGTRRHVSGSPHFFTSKGDFFCPSLSIAHDDDGYAVRFDADGFHRFMCAAFEG